MAQSIKCLLLDFSSGPDLTVGETEWQVRGFRAERVEPAWDSPFLCTSPTCALSLSLSLCLSLSLKINKQTFKKEIKQGALGG